MPAKVKHPAHKMGSESDLSNKQKGINPMPDPFPPNIVTTLLFGISHDQSTLFLSADAHQLANTSIEDHLYTGGLELCSAIKSEFSSNTWVSTCAGPVTG